MSAAMDNPLVYTGAMEVMRPYIEWEYKKMPWSRRMTIRLNIPRRITLMPSKNIVQGFPLVELPGTFIRKLIKKAYARHSLLLVCKTLARLCGPAPGKAYQTSGLYVPLMWWFTVPHTTIAVIGGTEKYAQVANPQPKVHRRVLGVPMNLTLRVDGRPGEDLIPGDDEWYYEVEFQHNSPCLCIRTGLAHWRVKKDYMEYSEIPFAWEYITSDCS